MTSEETKSKIKEIVEKIVAEVDPEKVILFGSHAWGHPGPDSDVDICVVKKKAQSRAEQLRERVKLRKSFFGYRFPPVDLLYFSRDDFNGRLAAGDFFTRQIVEKGEVMYEKASD
ncbi:MAG: nucleotidyltransferase domain-containing protein [Candidatus Andersenbacteria bacterium]|nr:nucleotidyltransferase domain-containing protein [bacterium]MDZ4225369.1 nucleotidyltransferase domain-containing protein [Candidatus Andersenbacteria bacterium]